MFINNWYAACIAADLDNRPQRSTILGCDFVLFRDPDGVARCLSDACCHRGASLSQGKCTGDRIVCPQHGWQYTGDGRCARIPAGTKAPDKPPKRARVPAYPTQEKYGLVFVFLGDMAADERPEIPDLLPEYEQPDQHHISTIVKTTGVNYLRMCENYNDPCHVNYVHEFGQWLPEGVTIETHELTDTYVKAFHAAWDEKGETSPDRGLLMEFSIIGVQSRNTQTIPGFPKQSVLAVTRPATAHETYIYMIIVHESDKLAEKDHRAVVEMTKNQVMGEDETVLSHARPHLAASPAEELLVESDLTVAQVRKMLQDYGRRHGEIDVAALDALRDSSIRVIPCPDHKSDPKGWVHKSVPLVSASAAAAGGELKAAG